MNRDIDIREHAVILKWDHGREEVKSESVELGTNAEGQKMRVVKQLDREGRIVRLKVHMI